EPAEQLGRHLAVGALRAVFIDDIEQHEFAAGARSWFPGHVLVPLSARARGRNTCRNSGLQAKARRARRALLIVSKRYAVCRLVAADLPLRRSASMSNVIFCPSTSPRIPARSTAET